ncbi:6-bladed beta-propeller [candidate division KSB1 bacterium]|nr:6-bladed beta-propeller [candidate division KSB1 bacterium]
MNIITRYSIGFAMLVINLYATDFNLVNEIENDEFYKLKKIAVSDEGVFVLDVGNQVVFQYALDGEFLHTISGPGQGPGEFIEPTNIIVNEDTLWILGHTLMRVGQFIEAEFSGLFQMEKMPIAFCKIANNFIIGQVFSTTFLSKYNSQGILQDSTSFQGAARKKFKNIPFPLFSTLTHMSSSDTHMYLTYEYKNAIEKYDQNLKLLKSKKIAKKLKEPKVKDGGNNNWYIEGDAIAKDIQYFNNKVYVLWMSQIAQVECEGLSQLSIFDENLKFIENVTIPDCVVGFDIYNGNLFGACNEPYPKVVIYEIQ